MKSSFNFGFAVFATVLIIAIHGLDYTDLEATKIECAKYDSCAKRSKYSYVPINCQCDESCVIYNDCCIDSKNLTENGLNSSRFTCMREKKYHSRGYYIISTCLENWQGSDEVKTKCEGLNDLRDPLMSTPATDKQRRVTYRNRYCAECNKAVPKELTYWDIDVHCKTSDTEVNYTSDDLVYSTDLNEWGITKDNVYYTCDISFDTPYLFFHLYSRQCKPNVIGTCPSTWHDMEINRLCAAYMALVVYEDDFYRNPHCALCNGVNVDKIECTGILTEQIRPAVAMLFDANLSDGDIVGVTIPEKPACPEGQKYDPFFKKCRELSCGLPGFTMLDGKCVNP